MRLLGFLSREVSLMYHGSLISFFLPYFLHNDGKSGKVTPAHGHPLPVKRASVARKWGN